MTYSRGTFPGFASVQLMHEQREEANGFELLTQEIDIQLITEYYQQTILPPATRPYLIIAPSEETRTTLPLLTKQIVS
jgi:hypothetical protein